MAEPVSPPKRSSGGRWFTHRWPWLLMLGPAVVVVAGSYTMYLAYQNQDALVVGDYYKQGKAINQDLRRDHAAAALALAVNIDYDAAAGQLRGKLTSRGAPYSERAVLHLAHATIPQRDLTFTVIPDAQGQFTAALPMLERSRWQITLVAEQRAWRLEGRWDWPTQRAVSVTAAVPVDG